LLEFDYMRWGEVSILSGNYDKALWCFKDLPAIYYDYWSVSIYQSYAYYLLGNTAKAHAALLERYTEKLQVDQSNLIKCFYLLQQGQNDVAAVLLKQLKEKITGIPFTGDSQKDLSLLMLDHAKSKFKSENLTISYLLDLASDLDPNNTEIIEIRYDYNVNLRRVGANDGLATETVNTLAAGKPAREAKREADILKAKEIALANRGMMVLWFGHDNKPAYFMAYQRSLANDAQIQEAAEVLIKKFPIRSNNPFLNYTFYKGYTEEEFYREAATKLKVKPKNINNKHGEIYMLD